VILGRALKNIGAGMTGGIIYTLKSNEKNINDEFIKREELDSTDRVSLDKLLQEHITDTKSSVQIDDLDRFIKLVPSL
jgi:glutamate synthase domain-containing protein 3